MKIPEPVKLKNGQYRIQLRLGGESICISAASVKECKRQAALVKAEYLNGRKPKAAPSSVREMTLEQVIDCYIEKYRAVLSPATIRGYQSCKKTRFKKYMGLKVKDISDWQKLINDETELAGAKTIKNAWSCLHVALTDLKYPVPEIKLPTVVTKEHSWLDASDELTRFLAAVKGSKYEIPILLGLLSLRRSEIMAITWDKVDLKRNVIKVQGAVVPDDKNKYVFKEANKESASRRSVRIFIPQLVDALKAVPEEERKGSVVTCHPNTIYKIVNKICEANNLPKIGTHGLRHTFASLAFDPSVGLPESEVKEIGGWSDPATVHKIYEHVSKSRRLKAENKMEQFYKENATQNATDSQNKPN